jgi:hypothetical protein
LKGLYLHPVISVNKETSKIKTTKAFLMKNKVQKL